MKLLVVAATKAEFSKVFEHFNLPDENFIQFDKFDILITGVGMTATAFALGRHLNSTYNLVVNVGIAGSFDKNIPLGSLVNINIDTFAELGAENLDEFITIDELGFGNNTFKATYQVSDLLTVTGITVNKVHGNIDNITKIEQKFNPQTESMEGAAVFYACNVLQIPCAQIRSISNHVEPRNKENWQIGLAIKNLNYWLIDFINAKTK
ncbi:MAG: futalosine hydrolase [Pedobacter sp.]|jgi:futalosine hydrolase|uniref:futalosine hydrolase n=1 Tax=Pedobacter sp. TaxID=1411316 RepID=UPI003562833D